MAMSRKDYQKFAALFAGEMAVAASRYEPILEEIRTLQNLVMSTADIFAQDNPRFNREKFYDASGMNG